MIRRIRCRCTMTGVAAALVAVVLGGCGGAESGSEKAERRVILDAGSDTMVNLAQAWAEEYSKVRPDVRVQVMGGGSGVGIASLTAGTCDLANCSRTMKEEEIAKIKSVHGKEPVEHAVAYDALAVYVHKDNPVDAISLEELAGIYGEGGELEEWGQVSAKAEHLGEIVRVSRQNNSGTYGYFRQAVLGKGRDYKLGSYDQSGSKDVVALVGKTPGAIGYSGMGYVTPAVKMLSVSEVEDGTAVEPTVQNALDGSYPITRPLYIYSIGEATGVLEEYMDWILSEAGQKIVADLGYVPVR